VRYINNRDAHGAAPLIHHGTRQSSWYTALAALHARALEGAAVLMRGGSRAHFFFGPAFFVAASSFFAAAFAASNAASNAVSFALCNTFFRR
jgi:hypothetical protein